MITISTVLQKFLKEQKKKFIPDILDSKVTWCTGYSEPNHGSDLAAIQCKAELVGDHYLVNGQKIWTTGAPWSQWIILLTRTDFKTKSKHKKYFHQSIKRAHCCSNFGFKKRRHRKKN